MIWKKDKSTNFEKTSMVMGFKAWNKDKARAATSKGGGTGGE